MKPNTIVEIPCMNQSAQGWFTFMKSEVWRNDKFLHLISLRKLKNVDKITLSINKSLSNKLQKCNILGGKILFQLNYFLCFYDFVIQSLSLI